MDKSDQMLVNVSVNQGYNHACSLKITHSKTQLNVYLHVNSLSDFSMISRSVSSAFQTTQEYIQHLKSTMKCRFESALRVYLNLGQTLSDPKQMEQ